MFRFEWTKKHTELLIYTCATLLIGIAIVFAILFPGYVFGVIGGILGAISPVFFGFAVAYLLNPICDFFEEKVFVKLTKDGVKKKSTRIFSVICAFLVALLIISLFVGLLVPQVVRSYNDLESKFEVYVKKASDFANGVIDDLRSRDEFKVLTSFFSVEKITDSFGDLVDSLFEFIGGAADKIFEYSSKVLSIAAKLVATLIFTAYFLLEKRRLFTLTAKVSDMIFPYHFVNSARYWISYTDSVFSSFITGKLVNSLIITAVNFIIFGIFGIPYYPLVALVCGVTDMIPYFGPFIGAIPCAFIILIADPIKVLWFAALVLVVQQIDGNIIGPKILGEKVGVDSLLIIVAITVGGGLFGIVGMFISVPVFTVLYHALTVFLNARLRKKGMSGEAKAYKTEEKEAAK